jgi:hypothetical protein
MQFIINLSEAEHKALAYVAVSPDEWIQNVVHARCEVAVNEIVAAEVQRKLSAGEAITGTKEDIVLAAPIQSAAERQAAFEADLALRYPAQQE